MRDKRIVRVTWDDTVTNHGWEEWDESADMKPDECVTVGFLIAETDRAVIVASTVSETETNARIAIPREFITQVEDL